MNVWACVTTKMTSHSDEQYVSPMRPMSGVRIPSQKQQDIPSKSLYVSHFLSTWNSRGFEFGAVLFLAKVYPGTLMPMSIYAFIRAAAAIVFSPLVGRYIDLTERLTVIRVSIISQRLSVLVSCLAFLLLLSKPGSWLARYVAFFCLVGLACVEKLGSIMNTVAVERDWVIVIADQREDMLQGMNSQMRRIDLFCKLVSPLAIALLDGISSNIAVISTLGLNASVVGIEYFLIARVYHKTPALATRWASSESDNIECTPLHEIGDNEISGGSKSDHSIFTDLRSYTQSAALLPSLSLAVLYLTVLSFSGQMTTFLLAVPSPRITSTTVGILRTISTVFELTATWLSPSVVAMIGPVRAGIWFLCWQLVCLTSGVGLLWTSGTSQASTSTGVIALIVSVVLSRVGLWSFDLVAQLHIQNSIESSHRGSFSSVEASLQNFFELLSFSSTIVFSRPEQFKYPALMSVAAIYLAAGLYAKFVRDRRGHLLHMPPCLKSGTREEYQPVDTTEMDDRGESF